MHHNIQDKNQSARIQVFSTLGEGWIAEEALAISGYSCMAWQDVEEAVTFSVNHGVDSDSTGSTMGQIMGAVMGFRIYPRQMVTKS